MSSVSRNVPGCTECCPRKCPGIIAGGLFAQGHWKARRIVRWDSGSLPDFEIAEFPNPFPGAPPGKYLRLTEATRPNGGIYSTPFNMTDYFEEILGNSQQPNVGLFGWWRTERAAGSGYGVANWLGIETGDAGDVSIVTLDANYRAINTLFTMSPDDDWIRLDEPIRGVGLGVKYLTDVTAEVGIGVGGSQAYGYYIPSIGVPPCPRKGRLAHYVPAGDGGAEGGHLQCGSSSPQPPPCYDLCETPWIPLALYTDDLLFPENGTIRMRFIGDSSDRCVYDSGVIDYFANRYRYQFYFGNSPLSDTTASQVRSLIPQNVTAFLVIAIESVNGLWPWTYFYWTTSPISCIADIDLQYGDCWVKSEAQFEQVLGRPYSAVGPFGRWCETEDYTRFLVPMTVRLLP
jgi:hypothetical protein